MWSFSKKQFGFHEKNLEFFGKILRFSKKFGGFSKSFAVLEKNWGLSKNLGAGAREESQNPLVRTINFPGLGRGGDRRPPLATAHPITFKYRSVPRMSRLEVKQFLHRNLCSLFLWSKVHEKSRSFQSSSMKKSRTSRQLHKIVRNSTQFAMKCK